LRSDQERRPALQWQEPARCRQEQPVHSTERWSSDLAAQDLELVTEHRDLDVLGRFTR
jgi:hypothetical protein